MRTLDFFKKDFIFTISLVLALIFSVFGKFDLTFIDLKTIFSLFGLMIVVKAFERLGILAVLAEKIIQLSKTTRHLVGYLILLSFFSSMFLTNDVAILSLIPIFITIVRKVKDFPNIAYSVVLFIMAANLGSSLLPFGNPQNLFLYSYYHLTIIQFISWMLPLALFSLIILFFLHLKIPKQTLSIQKKTSRPFFENKKLLLPGLSFLLMVLAVIGIVPYMYVVPLIFVAFFLGDKKVLAKLDYRLLGTFIFFFIIVGNLTEWKVFTDTLPAIFLHPLTSLFGAAFVSQVISNVPAAILIAPFGFEVQAVLLSVNVGGIGTLIASLANLIGFRLFQLYMPHLKVDFLKKFTWLNLLVFIVLLMASVVFIYY